MATIECMEGRYEVQDVGLARLFKWSPEIALVECDCGELTTLDRSETTCAWCGADHAGLVGEELSAHRVVYETVRPWLHADPLRAHPRRPHPTPAQNDPPTRDPLAVGLGV
jgi:hypothetical protein